MDHVPPPVQISGPRYLKGTAVSAPFPPPVYLWRVCQVHSLAPPDHLDGSSARGAAGLVQRGSSSSRVVVASVTSSVPGARPRHNGLSGA